MIDVSVVCRTAHMLSTMLSTGTIVLNYLSNGKFDKHMNRHANVTLFQGIVGAVMFGSGIANVFMIRDGKKLEDQVHKMWMHFFELKFIIALLLTPAIYPLTSVLAPEGQSNIDEPTKMKIQFYVIVFMLFYCPFIKFFREEVCLNFERDIVMDKVNELQAKFELSSKSRDRPLNFPDEDNDKDEVVSDDGQETLDPKSIGKKTKKAEGGKKAAPKIDKQMDIDNMSHEQLEEQLKNMENMEEQMKWMQDQQSLYMTEKTKVAQDQQQPMKKVRTKEDARATLNSIPRSGASLTEKVIKHRDQRASRTTQGQTGGTGNVDQADAEAVEIQRQLQYLREQEAILQRKLDSTQNANPSKMSQPQKSPSTSTGSKQKRPVVDKEFAEQIKKDYGEELFNQIYGDEQMPIDEDMLKEYGGEIINEQEDIEPRNLGRQQEYRGRPQQPEEEDEADVEGDKSSTLDEFMRLQNEMASQRVKKNSKGAK